MDMKPAFQSMLVPLLVAAATAGTVVVCAAADPQVLPGTKPLAGEGFSERMIAGIDRYLTRAAEGSIKERQASWRRDYSSAAAYAKSVELNRHSFREAIGAVDAVARPVRLEYVSGPDLPHVVAETDLYRVLAVRWSVFDGVFAEGLLVEPKKTGFPGIRPQVVSLPDADQTPEMLMGLEPGLESDAQFARRLADLGCRVIVPVLVDRRSKWSGNPEIVMTDQTHREWVYRQAVEMGRHLIGYEVQSVRAAVAWMTAGDDSGRGVTGVVGYGEGGLIALYAAALDTRIDVALISGFFDSRQRIWSEPIYRNVFGLLRQFGDAEVASLIAPRTLIVEHSGGPNVKGWPALLPGRRHCAAPGDLVPPAFESVRREVDRARALCTDGAQQIGRIEFVPGGDRAAVGPGSLEALGRLVEEFEKLDERDGGATIGTVEFESLSAVIAKLAAGFGRLDPNRPLLTDRRKAFDSDQRQRRQIDEWVKHSQRLLRRSEQIRAEYWRQAAPTKSLEQWKAAIDSYKDRLWNDVLGRLPNPTLPANARTRMIKQTDDWTMYEVQLDVWPEMFAWGYLVVPAGIEPGERRPVVVCQHGLEGLPDSVVTEDMTSRGYRSYRAYAVRLAERGFVTYAPHNPYRGGTAFRQLQRKANPLGLTLYSFILGQHQRTLEWLKSLPFVDAKRIGFYGLSYGGVSALRIPALLDDYALSICSAAFNDWTRKIMSLDYRSAYMFTREYEHFTFGLGSRFNNAELVALIAPRPFMVERGHDDGVAPDEWVAYEFAKVRRLYSKLGIADRAEIEFFDGGHVINGQGTFDFLHRHLDWPQP